MREERKKKDENGKFSPLIDEFKGCEYRYSYRKNSKKKKLQHYCKRSTHSTRKIRNSLLFFAAIAPAVCPDASPRFAGIFQPQKWSNDFVLCAWARGGGKRKFDSQYPIVRENNKQSADFFSLSLATSEKHRSFTLFLHSHLHIFVVRSHIYDIFSERLYNIR